MSNEKARPLAWLGSVAVAICRPLSNTVLNSGPNPRTVINSPSPPERSMETPVMRWSDSARFVSGSLPISSGAIASTIPCASRLMSRALVMLARMPVTTISPKSPLCASDVGVAAV